MKLSPDAIIEEILDELALGELGDSVDAFELTKTSPGSLVLDFGDRTLPQRTCHLTAME